MAARPDIPPARLDRAAGVATRRLFEEHGAMVLAICRSLIRDRGEAEDAAQEAFLSVHRSLLAGREPRNEHAWLATIARNECRARLRKSVRPVPRANVELEALVDLTDDVAERETVAELKAAIAELPARQRETVVLRDFYGLSPREIAAALGVATPVADALLFRARRRLRLRLSALRRAVQGIAVPAALRDELARLIPGFESSTTTAAAGGAGAAAAVKLISLPVAAKVAVATLGVAALGAAGTDRHVTAPADAAPEQPRAAIAAPSERAPAPRLPARQRVRTRSAAPTAAPRHHRRGRGPSASAGPTGSEETSESSDSGERAESSGSRSSGSGSDDSHSGHSSSSGSGSGDSHSSRSGPSDSGSSGSGSSGGDVDEPDEPEKAEEAEAKEPEEPEHEESEHSGSGHDGGD